MGFKLASAFVEILANDRQLDRDLNNVKSKVSNNINQIQGMLAGVGVTFGAGAFLRNAIGAAANAEEMQSKFEAVFKELTDEVDAFARTFANDIGRSVGETKKSLSEFQDVLVPLGLSRSAAAELSMALQQAAVDLASFNNTTDEFSTEALRKALTGEREMLKGLGIAILESDVKQRLLAKGQQDLEGQALKIAKAYATYELILEASADAQGDAARTAGSFTNRMKALRGAVADMAGAVGASVLPMLTVLVDVLVDAVLGFGRLNEKMDGFPALAIAVSASIFGVIGALQSLKAVGISTGRALQLALLGTGIGAAVVAVGVAIAGIVVGLQKMIEWLQGVTRVQKAWQEAVFAVKVAWFQLQEAIKTVVNELLEFLSMFLGVFGIDFPTAIESVKEDFIDLVVKGIKFFADWIVVISTGLRTVIQEFPLVWRIIRKGAEFAVLRMGDLFLGFFAFLGRAAMSAAESVVATLSNIPEMAKRVLAGEDLAAVVLSSFATEFGTRLREDFSKSLEMSDASAQAFAELQEPIREFNRRFQENLQEAKDAVNDATKVKDEAEAIQQELPTEVSLKLPSGFFGLEDFSRKLQEQLLKDDDKNNERKLVDIGESQRKLQEDQLEVQKATLDAVQANKLNVSIA